MPDQPREVSASRSDAVTWQTIVQPGPVTIWMDEIPDVAGLQPADLPADLHLMLQRLAHPEDGPIRRFFRKLQACRGTGTVKT